MYITRITENAYIAPNRSNSQSSISLFGNPRSDRWSNKTETYTATNNLKKIKRINQYNKVYSTSLCDIFSAPASQSRASNRYHTPSGRNKSSLDRSCKNRMLARSHLIMFLKWFNCSFLKCVQLPDHHVIFKSAISQNTRKYAFSWIVDASSSSPKRPTPLPTNRFLL